MTFNKKIYGLALLGLSVYSVWGSVLFVPTSALAAGECFTASGFGTANVDAGVYTDTGLVQSGKSVYFNNFYYVANSGGGGYEWSIANNTSTPPTAPLYYTSPNAGALPSDFTSGQWTVRVDNGATAPAGTFVLATCPGGGSATSTLAQFGFWGNIASSTIALGVNNISGVELALGLFFAFLVFFLVVGVSTKFFKKLLHWN